MQRFTWRDMADMHLAYGAANGNGREAQRIYQERFPERHQPHHSTFASMDRRLRESGSFKVNMHDTGRQRTIRTPRFEEDVLERVAQDPSTSTRAIAHSMDVHHSTVWQVLREQQLRPYHVQKVQGLVPEDFPRRVEFCRWFLERRAEHRGFPARVLYTDESTFTREGVFNSRNSHIWEEENPHATAVHSYQEKFSVNIWAGIVGDYLIGPYLLPARLSGPIYRVFLENTLPELLENVPLGIRRGMWFQHDGAPAHFAIIARDFLNETFGPRWIARGGPVPWPARSPDLNPLDYFLWGHLKDLVYDTPVQSQEELVARVVVACATVRQTDGIFARVRRSMVRRCRLCVEVHGQNFEHLL